MHLQDNQTHVSTAFKDNSFVSVYNEADFSDYLYTAPAFEAGFLPLEPTDEQKPAQPIVIKSHIRPAETSNTGTTPPPRAVLGRAQTETATLVKPATKTAQPESAASKPTERQERRPSFLGVTPVDVHHEHHEHHEHKDEDKAHHEHRRHSSESHQPMSWWPEDEQKARHVWVEEEDLSADEEEDFCEDEAWIDDDSC